jgi:hypothetical protein
MTIYTCEGCGQRVGAGEGYIHSTDEPGKYWAIHHTGCADMSADYCIGVPEHWWDLLTMHREYAESVHNASVSRAAHFA